METESGEGVRQPTEQKQKGGEGWRAGGRQRRTWEEEPQRDNGEPSPHSRGPSPFPEAAGVGVIGVEGSCQPQVQGQEEEGGQR